MPDADSVTGAVTPDNDRSQLTYANLFGVAEVYFRLAEEHARAKD